MQRLAAALVDSDASWRGPALAFDCGVDDVLYDANLRVRDFFRGLGIPYEFHEYPGGHTWEYWSARLSEQLRFTLRHLAPPEPEEAEP